MGQFEKVAIGVVEVDVRPRFAHLHVSLDQSLFDGTNFIFSCAECQMWVVLSGWSGVASGRTEKFSHSSPPISIHK